MAASQTGQQVSEFHGLAWVRDLWTSEPQWTVDLDEDAIKRTMQHVLRLSGPCRVSFLAQGQCNKLYSIENPPRHFITRVTLPIEPTWKTLSEVATTEWVRDNTSLPVPEILGFHATCSNPIGFEWIAMTKMPGRPLHEVWGQISFEAKKGVIKRLAEFAVETFDQQFFRIGSIFPEERPATPYLSPPPEPEPDDDDGSPGPGALSEPIMEDRRGEPQIGGVISYDFNWDDRIDHNVCRGPFQNSREWMAARLKATEDSATERLYRALNRDDEESEALLDDFDCTFNIIDQLKRRINVFFPAAGPEPEATMLLHDKMTRSNILLRDNGSLSAVVDWECISVVPLWMGCRYPTFLQGRDRYIGPSRENYRHDAHGNVDALYWEHLDEFEMTALRQCFMHTVSMLKPEWRRIHETSVAKRDFDLAVKYCDDSILKHEVERWLNEMDMGMQGMQGLEERLYKYFL
ncbi:hypothetical protein B0T10DRAFT_414780 [Thelonectria olida]|uniref:Aminoglycoside phosphotransferase domain-containing protein n=1 Tax=Thelonectria olida TaxID=1576542 RepID=A0A9P9AJX8_9HYPO|nr:hypothetical protein B0T10DRAFT_414780 [Thelonectria olida]